ncbi:MULTISPECIES: site-2 protease family protein [unclassified Kribbella]|uniref:site-2 protease family protein n=1 Tax=unclassified Kribbella TaxID=2644121 RepID=UPI0030182F84
MRQTIRFGRIAGVEVGANWSLILLIVLVANGLAAVVLPELTPGHAAAAYWTAGVVCALLIAGSVLLHELAHSIVALRAGLPVQRITLWMLGGVSLLGGEPATPRAAFWIAASGPLTSLALGAGSGAGALLLDAAGTPQLIVMSAWWLGTMNVFLGLFNLLPGNPLDGGRILRAVLWWRSGNPDRAEITAAKAGRVLGYLIAALGFAQWLDGQLAGLWLLLIGFVIITSVTAESAAARMRIALGTTTVADVMSPPGVTGYASMAVGRFVTEVAPRTRQVVFAVVDLDGHPTGTVSLRRLTRVPAGLRTSTRLADVQTPLKDVPVARPDELLADLVSRMTQGSDELALVLEDERRLVGVVTGYDVARTVQLATLHPVRPEPSPT